MTGGICCFSGYIKPMTLSLLLWLHQTNEYDGICYFSGYIKPMTMTLLLWLDSHWFDVTREATS
jgi:hypothetical protein